MGHKPELRSSGENRVMFQFSAIWTYVLTDKVECQESRLPAAAGLTSLTNHVIETPPRIVITVFLWYLAL